jgi:glutamate-1-semialdehyde 2,1-aminomutase
MVPLMSELGAVPTVTLREHYLRKTAGSAERYQRARCMFPSGVTHDVRYLKPHPVYISHASGSRKWDVDGNEYVDYFGGHGALILGHNHPEVLEAVRQQISRGVHFGASHDLELEWAALIQDMIPCAERVRFTVSGTEATHLALRVARAYTERTKILRFASHFHGWHDHVAFGPDGPAAGISKSISDEVVLCPPNDLDRVKQALCDQRDIAAVIIEPTGSTFGQVPTGPEFLRDLRQLTTDCGTVLIFDEVITGFRCSPGGAQELYGIIPDLTTLAKIVAGGYPGAALVGRASIMDMLEFRTNGAGTLPPQVPHQGTFNAAPVSAAAGIATLKIIRSSNVIERANRTAGEIRAGMNQVIRECGIPWSVYGTFSGFHIFTNPANEAITPEDIASGQVHWRKLKGAVPIDKLHKIRLGFLCDGVDIVTWPGGTVSAMHDAGDVDRTVTAFRNTIRALDAERHL